MGKQSLLVSNRASKGRGRERETSEGGREEGRKGILETEMREVWVGVSKGPTGDGVICWPLRLAGPQLTGQSGPLAAGHRQCRSH